MVDTTPEHFSPSVSPDRDPAASGSGERRHDLDRLRVIACYLLLLFHVLMIFSPAPFYHVRNAEHSIVAMVMSGFISLWHMPLLFLLAGWSLYASLRGRGLPAFLRERVFKLAVPLIAGCILFAPYIKYLELRGGMDLNRHGFSVTEELQPSFATVIPDGLPVAAPFDESFLDFLPSFFSDLDRFSWSHLWFLAYLLAFTLLYLPAFSLLIGRRGVRERVSGCWVYAPLLPLVVGEVVLRPHFPGPYNLYSDWANFSQFSVYLVAGFLLARIPAIESAIAAEWRRAAGLALGAMLLLLGGILGLVETKWLFLVAPSIAGWCAIVTLLGFTRERFRGSAPWLAYGRETAFPVFFLHQPVVVVLGFFLVELPLGLLTKFLLILFTSTAATLAIYHLLVKPFAPTRFLCGIGAGAGRRVRAAAAVAAEPRSALGLDV